MSEWILDRLFEAKDQAEPRFAFQGTVYCMRALAEAVNNGSCSNEELKKTYSKVKRRPTTIEAVTFVFENMFIAYHNFASLCSINDDIISKYDTCRSAIVAWCYAVPKK